MAYYDDSTAPLGHRGQRLVYKDAARCNNDDEYAPKLYSELSALCALTWRGVIFVIHSPCALTLLAQFSQLELAQNSGKASATARETYPCQDANRRGKVCRSVPTAHDKIGIGAEKQIDEIGGLLPDQQPSSIYLGVREGLSITGDLSL